MSYKKIIMFQVEPQDLLEQLSTDASPALRRLIKQSSPTKSFRSLAVDCDLSLMQVNVVTNHYLEYPVFIVPKNS